MKTLHNGVLAIALLLAVAVSACAQTKGVVKRGNSYVKVISATSERYLPGIQGIDPTTNYRITIQWRSNTKPTAFYWRPQEGWMNCIIVKPKGDVEISPSAVLRNQQVVIVPVPDASRTPVPDFVTPATRNTLFFQVGNSWYSIPVKITKKPDLIAQ